MATDFIAGCIGGAAGVLAGHPLDTIKVRLQVTNTRPKQSIINCVTHSIKHEGVTGLYRGLSAPLCGMAAINALTFGIQGNVSRLFREPESLLAQFTAGMIAGGCQSVVVSPMELVKSQVQVATVRNCNYKQFQSPWNCFCHILYHQGLQRGLMRGFYVTAAREVPAFGIYFGTYELMMSLLYRENAKALPGMLLAGGTAGVASWLLTCPIDVIKTRIQTDGMYGVVRYSSYRHCVLQTYREEGLVGFTRGVTSACLRAFPTNAITLATVTMILQMAYQCERSAGKTRAEQYVPADMFLKQLQRRNQITAAYPAPHLSVTKLTLEVKSDREPSHKQSTTIHMDRDNVRLDELLSALISRLDTRRQVPQQLSNVGCKQCKHQDLEELVNDDELQDWIEWKTQPGTHVDRKPGGNRNNCHVRRKRTVLTHIIEYEEFDDTI